MQLPRVALLFVTDGRDDLRAATFESFNANARSLEVATIIEVDDRDHTLGFCGAVREAWARLRAVAGETPFDYVFHLETDFDFLRSFDVKAMSRVLDTQPHVCQVALRRGPVNEYERGFGRDLSMMWPDAHTERHTSGHAWLEHRLNWTTNPCIYRRSLVERFEWPNPPRCEEAFGTTMIAEGYSFAFWGGRGEPWLEHTGHTRVGNGY